MIDWLDLAADLGAYDAGVEVRVGLPEGSEPLPLALSWGYRTRGPIEDGPSDRKRREWRLRLEAYPLLYAEDRTRLHGILTGGASFGVRYHEIQLPSSFDDGDWGADELGSTNLSFLRDESRLEAALGVDLRVARRRPDGTTRWGGAYSFVAMPYWVVRAGEPYDASCNHCWQWSPVGYAQNFGVFFFVTAGFFRVFHRVTVP